MICPNHEWRFKLESGANMQNPELFIPTYPVKVKNENIYIGLEGESGNIAYGKKGFYFTIEPQVQCPNDSAAP